MKPPGAMGKRLKKKKFAAYAFGQNKIIIIIIIIISIITYYHYYHYKALIMEWDSHFDTLS